MFFQQQEAAEALKMLRKAANLDEKNVLTPEATLALFYERYRGTTRTRSFG